MPCPPLPSKLLQAAAFHNTVRSLFSLGNGAYTCSYIRLYGHANASVVPLLTCYAGLLITRENRRLGRPVVVVEPVSWRLQTCSDDSSGNRYSQHHVAPFRPLKRNCMQCGISKGLSSRSMQRRKGREALPEGVSLLSPRPESESPDASVIIITARLLGTAPSEASPPSPRNRSRNRGRVADCLTSPQKLPETPKPR